MLKILKNCNVYTPKHIGKRDILIAGEKIARLAHQIQPLEQVEVFDVEGADVIPGYVDMHSHLIGGGGERGPSSRVPEARLSELIAGGITTCVGLLGTDGITRSLEGLLAKTRALSDEGITAYMLSGSYAVPGPSITGTVERDIVLIDKCIGVKLAISDHRDSSPSVEEIQSLATQARRGGLLSGKAGVVMVHVGRSEKGLFKLFAAIEQSDIPYFTIIPTHMGKTHDLLDQGIAYNKKGGFVDLTQNEQTVDSVCYLKEQGANLSFVSISSDSYGSKNVFDEYGESVSMTTHTPKELHSGMIDIINDSGLSFEEALALFTMNPSRALKLPDKGRIHEGADADLLILRNSDLKIQGVLARGKLAMWEEKVLIKGKFE